MAKVVLLVFTIIAHSTINQVSSNWLPVDYYCLLNLRPVASGIDYLFDLLHLS